MKLISEFWKEEDAVGVVEVILILVVLIGLVLIFKKQLVSLVNSLMEKVTNQSNTFALISDENYSKFRQVRKLLFCSWSFHAATAYACVSKSVELNCIKLCTKTEDKA